MNRMTEQNAEQMLAFIGKMVDFENLPLDDEKTFGLFQEADTDGIFMMESEWDKYDLLQVKPKSFDELAASIAMSHSVVLNPYLYTYIKIGYINPFSYPRFKELPRVKDILSDTRGILLWKEQKEEILDCIGSLSEDDKECYKMAIRIVLSEIELRAKSIASRAFFRKRALLCYKLAYAKAHFPMEFEDCRKALCG